MAEQTAKIIIAADDRTQAAFESAKAGLSSLQSSAASMAGVVAAASAALASLTVVAKFQDFVKGAAALDDMAEKTGASVEKLSALQSVARVSGTDIATLEGGLVKFTKALNGIDTESSKAQQAFKALGLDPQKLRTQDTAEAFKTLADRLAEFRDDGTKTAAVLEILGKNGAQLLPYLKDLAETGELQAKVTAEQAAQAENLEKNLVRLFATKNAGFKEFSAAILPTVDAFVKALLEAANSADGLRSEIKRLSAEGQIEEWARTGATALAYLVDGAKGAVAAIELIGKAWVVSFKGLELAQAVAIKGPLALVSSDVRDKAKELSSFGKSFAQDFNKIAENFTAGSLVERLKRQFAKQDADRSGQEEGADSRVPRRSLGFKVQGAEKVAKFKDELKGIDGFVDSIAQRLVGQTEGEFEQLRQRAIDVFNKVDFSKLSPEQFDKFVAKLALVNEQIDLLEEKSIGAATAKALGDSLKIMADAAERADDALRGFNEAQSRATQDMEFELSMVGKLSAERQKLAAIRRIDLDAQRQIATIPENASNRDERIADITKAAEASKERTGELFDSIRTKSRDAFLGLSSAALDYFDRVSNGAENVRTLFNRAFDSMEETLVKFVQTGKLDFKTLVDSIIADIARIQIRQNITGPLAQAVGGIDFGKIFGGSQPQQLSGPTDGGGGFLSGLFDFLPKFATGIDYVPYDMAAIIHKGERVVPAAENLAGGSGSGFSPTYVYNIDSRSDQATIAAMLRQSEERTKADILRSRQAGGVFA